ncbi:hypothetical protein ACIQMY_25300 [Streptomyces sp. NPDC091368]|uniref:hypothetical protein n=1 Tax=Streptomyces sp. NPDC091368 TaxID=3365993 RepID=UPI00382FF523
MSLQSCYQATRRGEKQFLNDITPGDQLFVINEHSDRSKSYCEWIVTDKVDWFGHREVESQGHGGRMTAQMLLRREREVHTRCPSHLPNLDVPDNHGAYTEQAQRAAKAVGDLHAREASDAMSAKYRRLARR